MRHVQHHTGPSVESLVEDLQPTRTSTPEPRTPTARQRPGGESVLHGLSEVRPGLRRQSSFSSTVSDESDIEHPASEARPSTRPGLGNAPPGRPHRPISPAPSDDGTTHLDHNDLHGFYEPTRPHSPPLAGQQDIPAHPWPDGAAPPAYHHQAPWNAPLQSDADIDAHVDNLLNRHGSRVPRGLQNLARPLMQRYFRHRRDNAGNPGGYWGNNGNGMSNIGTLAQLAGGAGSTFMTVFVAFEKFMQSVAQAEASLINNSGQIIAHAAEKR